MWFSLKDFLIDTYFFCIIFLNDHIQYRLAAQKIYHGVTGSYVVTWCKQYTRGTLANWPCWLTTWITGTRRYLWPTRLSLISGVSVVIKMISYHCRKSSFGDKIIMRMTYFHNGSSHIFQMTYLYWNTPLTITHAYRVGAGILISAGLQWNHWAC